MTILYNTETNEVLSFHNPQYIVDGLPASVTHPIVELQYVNTPAPDYNSNTQKLMSDWTITETLYVKTWTVTNLTEQELEEIRISRIPNEITRRQLKLGMVSILNLSPTLIDDMINQIPDENDKLVTTILWEESGTFDITHPLVQQFSTSLGLTQRQLEDFFTEAGKL